MGRRAHLKLRNALTLPVVVAAIAFAAFPAGAENPARTSQTEAELQELRLLLRGRTARPTEAELAVMVREAAEQGNLEAQYILADIYRSKTELHDLAEMAKWYRKAAMAGHAKSQFALGFIYHIGMGVQRDYVQAYAWLSHVASSVPEDQLAAGPPGIGIYKRAQEYTCIIARLSENCKQLGVVRLLLGSLEEVMTRDQVIEAERIAREWWLREHPEDAPR